MAVRRRPSGSVRRCCCSRCCPALVVRAGRLAEDEHHRRQRDQPERRRGGQVGHENRHGVRAGALGEDEERPNTEEAEDRGESDPRPVITPAVRPGQPQPHASTDRCAGEHGDNLGEHENVPPPAGEVHVLNGGRPDAAESHQDGDEDGQVKRRTGAHEPDGVPHRAWCAWHAKVQPGGQVSGEGGQLCAGPRRQRLAHPQVEFVFDQPALHERGLEGADHLLAVGV